MANNRLNFSTSRLADPTLGAQRALSNIGGIMDKRNTRAQQDIANKRAEEQLAIQKAQEGRAADTYSAKLADDAAITRSMQENLANPELLGLTEDVYAKIDAQYKDTIGPDGQVIIDPRKQALYDKANAAMMPGNVLQDAFTSPLSTEDYQSRVLAGMGDASPAARAQAMALVKAQFPSKADSTDAKNKALTASDRGFAAAQQKLIGQGAINTYKEGGAGTPSGKDPTGAYSKQSFASATDDFINKAALEENWNFKSVDASELRDKAADLQKSGGLVTVGDKTVTVSINEFLDAAKSSKDSDDNWFFNKGLDEDEFNKRLVDFAGKHPDKGTKYGVGKARSPVTTSKTIDKRAWAQLQESHDVEQANINKRFGPGATTETAQNAVDRIFQDVFDKPAAKVSGKKPVGDKAAPKSSFSKDTAIGRGMLSKAGDNAVLQVATDTPATFVKEYEALSAGKRNKVDEVLRNSTYTGYVAPAGSPTDAQGSSAPTIAAVSPETKQAVTGSYADIGLKTLGITPDPTIPIKDRLTKDPALVKALSEDITNLPVDSDDNFTRRKNLAANNNAISALREKYGVSLEELKALRSDSTVPYATRKHIETVLKYR